MGDVRRELQVHFPPLSSNLPSPDTKLRQQPAYLVAALCLSSALDTSANVLGWSISRNG